MGLASAVKKLMGKGAGVVLAWAEDAPDRQFTWGDPSGEALARHEAVFGAASKLANVVASQPLRLMKGYDVAKDHELNRLLMYRPSSGYTPFTFWQTMEACRVSTGNCYAIKVPDALGGVESIDPVDPQLMSPFRDPDTGDIWYDYTPRDGPRMFLPERMVIHCRYIAAAGDKGISPMDVLHPSLHYADQMRSFSLQQAKGISGAVVLELPGNPGEKRTEDAVEVFKKHYTRDGIITLTGGAKASVINRQVFSGNALEIDRLTVNRVARALNLPPSLLGDYSAKSYTSQEQQQLEFLSGTINAINRMYKTELEAKLLTWQMVQDGYHIEWDTSGLRMADAVNRANVDQIHVRSGIATPNQVAERNGYPPVPGGDQRLISRDLQPLNAMGGIDNG